MTRGLCEESSDLSEYERIRLKNIEERKKKLESLGINLESVAPPKKAKKSVSPPKSRVLPKRFSSRLRGLEAKEEEQPLTMGSVVLKKEEPFTPLRKTLNLEQLLEMDDETQGSDLKDAFSEYGSLKVRASDSSAVLDLNSLSLKENGIKKIIPSRISSMSFHPSRETLLLAAGDKLGNVSLWDLARREKVHSFRPHDHNVNCISFDAFDPAKLVMTSYDGCLRMLDLRSTKLKSLYDTNDNFTTYHAQVDAHQYLITLGKGGNVGVLDSRDRKKDLSDIINVFPNGSYAKTVSYKDNLFVCGNSKSECFVYDIRKSKKPCFTLLGHAGSVSSAFFNPLNGQEVLSTDYKDKIRLYDLSKSSHTVSPSWSLSHNNHTGRWLTTFKANWHPSKSLIFVGSMNNPRQVHVLDSHGDMAKVLSGEHLTSTASVVVPHPYVNIVAGGNSSGKVFIFEE